MNFQIKNEIPEPRFRYSFLDLAREYIHHEFGPAQEFSDQELRDKLASWDPTEKQNALLELIAGRINTPPVSKTDYFMEILHDGLLLDFRKKIKKSYYRAFNQYLDQKESLHGPAPKIVIQWIHDHLSKRIGYNIINNEYWDASSALLLRVSGRPRAGTPESLAYKDWISKRLKK